MTSPVVLVTRDEQGANLRIDLFKSETAYYKGQPSVVLTFDFDKNLWSGVSLRPSRGPVGSLAADLLRRLTDNPWADVSDVATFTKLRRAA